MLPPQKPSLLTHVSSLIDRELTYDESAAEVTYLSGMSEQTDKYLRLVARGI